VAVERVRGPVDPTSSAQIVVGILSAIVIGVADAAMIVFGIAGARGAFEFVPVRIWVVSPLTWLFVAVIAAGPVVVVARRWAGLGVAGTLAIVFVSIRLRTHPALLTVGIVAILAVLAVGAPRIREWTARPRRSHALGLAASLVAAAGIGAVPSPAPAPPPAAPENDAPNVIVIFLDTVRYDAVFDPAGNVHPGLATLARLRRGSTVFTRAYATSSWTLPSHLSASTGLPPHELGVSFDAQVYTGATPTLAERFRTRGYRTAAVLSNSFLNAGSGFARGFDAFHQAETGLDLCRTAPGMLTELYSAWFSASICNWTASEVTRRALALMTDDTRPFFLTLNYMDAHDPYYVERSCGGGRGYREALRCLDRHLAPIVDWKSSRRGTVVAVLSDHGESFGERGLERHGNGLHLELLHVPMMIQSGGSAETVSAPVSIAALPGLVGAGGPSVRIGEPALALLHPPAAAGLPSEWSATSDVWHLIVRERGDDELYHLASDPLQEQNLIFASPADPAIDDLRASIEEMRRSPRPDAGPFRSLGYIH
jgi:hypothetical protein